MTAGLRIGFALSGLLHVAVVAALSRPADHAVVAVDQPQPITLQLAMFQEAEPVAERPAAESAIPEAPLSDTPPPPPVEPEIAEVPELVPEPAATQVEPIPQPRPVERPRLHPKRVLKPVTQTVTKVDREPPRPQPRPAPAPTVVASKVVSPQPARAVSDTHERQHYLAALAATIDRNKFYPRAARRRGEEGTVVVRFVIRKDGQLTELTIVESSGSARLDEAALQTLQRVTPFRAIPDALNRDSWSISVPIAFNLRG